MKKLLTLTAVGVILTAPASAVQKCVALDMDTTQCTATSYTPSYSTEWSVDCTTDGVSVPITGIATCSSTAGSEEGEFVDTVEMPGSTGEWYCWCKMTSPAVSPWVYYSSMSYSFCWQKCASYCAQRTAGTYWFREGLFSSLSN